MKKNIIIAILAVFSIISTSSVVSMSKKASYWMQRTIAAEAVIERVEEDNEDYILDVLSESDVWYEWYEVFCPGIKYSMTTTRYPNGKEARKEFYKYKRKK